MKIMKIKSKVALGGITSGLMGAATVFGVYMLTQMNSEDNQHKSAAIISKTSRPGRIGKGGLRGTKVEELFETIKMQEVCNNKKGIWDGKKCQINDNLNLEEVDVEIDSVFDDEKLTGLEKDKCHEKGGYYQITSTSHNTYSCLKPGVILRRDYEKEITEWDEVKSVQKPYENQQSLNYFYSEGFFDFRRNDKQYAVVIKDEKLTGDLEKWNFAQHLKSGEKGASIADICEWSKKSMGDDWRKYFLYNEKSGKGWDCSSKKEIMFLKRDEEAN